MLQGQPTSRTNLCFSRLRELNSDSRRHQAGHARVEGNVLAGVKVQTGVAGMRVRWDDGVGAETPDS